MFLDCVVLLWTVGYCLVNMHHALKFKFLHTFNSELLSSSNCCGHSGCWVNAGPVFNCKSGEGSLYIYFSESSVWNFTK